jgi:hypothetical protein
MTSLRVLAILIAVVKIGLAALLVLAVDADASHAFGVAYRPPEWHAVHYVLILGAIGIAYPHSLIPSPALVSFVFLVLASLPIFAAISDCFSGKDSLAGIGVVLAVGAFLLAVVESLARRRCASRESKRGAKSGCESLTRKNGGVQNKVHP